MMKDMIQDIYDTRNWDTFYVCVSRARGDFDEIKDQKIINLGRPFNDPSHQNKVISDSHALSYSKVLLVAPLSLNLDITIQKKVSLKG